MSPEPSVVEIPGFVRNRGDCGLFEVGPTDEAPLSEKGFADLLQLDGRIAQSWCLELQDEGLLLACHAKNLDADLVEAAADLEGLEGGEALWVAEAGGGALDHFGREALLVGGEGGRRSHHHHPAFAVDDVGELLGEGGLAEQVLLGTKYEAKRRKKNEKRNKKNKQNSKE